MLTFQRINSTTLYHGFARFKPPVSNGHLVVIAMIEGTPECWMCEGKEGIDALKTYYHDNWMRHKIVFTIFKEEVC